MPKTRPCDVLGIDVPIILAAMGAAPRRGISPRPFLPTAAIIAQLIAATETALSRGPHFVAS